MRVAPTNPTVAKVFPYIIIMELADIEKIVVVSSLIGVLTVLSLKFLSDKNEMNIRFKVQCNLLTIWLLFSTLWPVAWTYIIGIDVINKYPYAFIGLAWTLLLFTIDIVGISHHTIETEGENKKSMFTFDSNAITGLAFALGGVVLSNIGQDFAKHASPVFSSVILLCMAFLIPSPGIRAMSLSGISIQAIQKSFIYCTVGLLVTMVSINLSHGLKNRTSQAIKSS